MKKIAAPNFTEYAMFYDPYLSLIDKNISVLDQLKSSSKQFIDWVKIQEEKNLIIGYQEGKWSVKDIIMHLIDTERVFIYRAMRFARNDQSPQPYFDENVFASEANANKVNTKKLLKEYAYCRQLTIQFFNNLNAEQMLRKGMASNYPMSVRACAWIILGHELHHRKVVRERYIPIFK